MNLDHIRYHEEDDLPADERTIREYYRIERESFDEKDIEYITIISHGQLERMRKLDELTKWMSIDEVETVLHAYEALADLAATLKHE